MTESRHGRRRMSLLLAGVALLVAIVLFATQHSGSATASSTFASYPALTSDAPSELPLISAYHDHQPGEAVGPGYPAVAPGPKWPEPSTIRRIPVSAPGVSLWIAKTAEGGICEMSYLAGNAGMGVSCTKSEAGLANGAGGELTTASGAVLYAGVAPTGISSVNEKMPDGSTVTVPVTDNGWAYVYKTAGSAVATTAKLRPRARKARR